MHRSIQLLRASRITWVAAILVASAASADTGLGRHRRMYAVPVPGPVMTDGKLADGSALKLPDPLVWKNEWSHPYYWAPFILMGEWRQTPASGN